jgi:hypothetical protein
LPLPASYLSPALHLDLPLPAQAPLAETSALLTFSAAGCFPRELEERERVKEREIEREIERWKERRTEERLRKRHIYVCVCVCRKRE